MPAGYGGLPGEAAQPVPLRLTRADAPKYARFLERFFSKTENLCAASYTAARLCVILGSTAQLKYEFEMKMVVRWRICVIVTKVMVARAVSLPFFALKGERSMPKTKFQEVVFTILMVFVMVYAMICYNISLNIGGMTNAVFLMAFHELVIMGPAAFVLDFFFFGSLSKKLAFRVVNPCQDRPIFVILAISSLTVCLMCPSMSLIATLLFKNAGSQFVAVWLQTTAMNFPMAFFWQIFFAGPLVRAMFSQLFREKESQVLKEEEAYLEGGAAR